MKQELLDKYSVPVPRYTSYPPANFFNDSFSAESYRKAIVESNNQDPQHISIYIHIPFCHQLCYYCGCNSQLFRERNTINAYLDALKKEIKMVLPHLNKNRKISQIHYGGGTPTSQPVEVLKELNQLILSEFDCIDNPEIAIECHPGFMDASYWENLTDAGFNRVSIGIQDFNEDVLKAVNRKKTLIPIKQIVDIVKSKGLSYNMDFIYGLPIQTEESFAKTIEEAISLQPDRLVTFSYAHVPWVNKLQNKLEEIGLPIVSVKNNIFEITKKLLSEAGYKTIGLDHFVKPEDELYSALISKKLHRNFQGYCTRRTTGQVYAFGITGISQLANAYSQNTKDIDQYIEQVNKGLFPIAKGYILNEEEQIVRTVISELMCNYTINWKTISDDLSISVNSVKEAVNYTESVLMTFANDGIITFDNDHLSICPEARAFVRNVAASFDKLILTKENRYSKSI